MKKKISIVFVAFLITMNLYAFSSQAITPSFTQTGNVTTPGGSVSYPLTVSSDGIYKFYFSSVFSSNSRVSILDSNGELIFMNNPSSSTPLCRYLKTGTSYTLKIQSTGSTYGSFTIKGEPISSHMDLKWVYMFRSPQMATILTDTYRTGHYAVDIVNRNSSGINICGGYKMYSVGKGRVLEADYRATMGYFAAITLESGLVVRYLHMDSADDLKVSKGGTVTSLTHIGNVGSLGNTSTGNHLHFDINNTGGWSATWTTSNTYNPQDFFTEI
ncbi:MAG: M23 family metallopeptidase [Oscillospiraceae bacterium]|nr:M23 family metallopeptidase [Oscillospiraceae bacterium]